MTSQSEQSNFKTFKAPRDELDLGDQGLWSVSSAKPGYGVNQLRDDSISTLWQSEGPQPHFIRIEFPKKTAVTQISIYVDMAMDDSYTPCKLAISVGTFKHDLQVIKAVELKNPRGWQNIRLSSESEDEEEPESSDDSDEDVDDDTDTFIKGHLFQVAVLANHLNGKDTHIRCLKIFGPRAQAKPRLDGFGPNHHELLLMHETIR
ncbi:anaphase-promoting complex, subunit 10/DOC domain-containing protein [Phakopsora pachyrhizi]|uniref:Anaphase-promoting complex subunit 10 n=1 Tax=Phakopsora pachyrhizi TaxID=170000 RepID=A0AAV0BHR9_PHAPC|nr:anaphase-promoting complex, subunit 10/DOC domain-containing protein [Phakopsora pachyrhizi]CAH7686763.1 anaphase-promoting complex, subunit 10/DOC domain-containing protein [Phakopsora pachyrhizi]